MTGESKPRFQHRIVDWIRSRAPRLAHQGSGITIVCLTLMLGVAPTGAVGAVPDPLSLDQALLSIGADPGADVSPDLRARLPRRQSLYLDCHRLAFGASGTTDPDRSRPLQALLTPQAARQLELMERFFDVLLADQGFASASEAMAVAYIQFDRAAVRRDLGQVSDLRVLELEAVYQSFLTRRTASELGQQWTRALLAQALGHPDDLPRNLEPPVLPTLPETLPTLDEIVTQATAGPTVRALETGRNQAERTFIGLELRQQVLELQLRLQALAAVQRSLRSESAWRDMKLDESRTLYEQEFTADLGYSMSQQTQARLEEQRAAYCQTLTWAELNALAGRPLWVHTARDH